MNEKCLESLFPVRLCKIELDAEKTSVFKVCKTIFRGGDLSEVVLYTGADETRARKVYKRAVKRYYWLDPALYIVITLCIILSLLGLLSPSH